MNNVFDDMGDYWSEIADGSKTLSQVKFLEDNLERTGIILDAACGTGRHLSALSEKGFEVVGLDISINLLKIVKQRYNKAVVIRGDLKFLPFKVHAFGAVISMDTSLGYLESEKDDFKVFMEIRRVLRFGSFFVIDVFNRDLLLRKYFHKNYLKKLKWATLSLLTNIGIHWFLFRVFQWRDYPSFFLLQERTVSINGDFLEDLWIICDKKTRRLSIFRHHARLYEYHIVKSLLISSGFSVRSLYGDYDRRNYTRSSQRLIVIAY